MSSSLNKIKASIILATYEWPEALAMVLSGLLTQTDKSFEVVLADDGSDERTRKVVDDYKKRSFFTIHHLWQENKGFRKSRILNQAILKSCGETLIFLDGDCIPHKDFVAQHLLLQDPLSYVAGRRVDLSENFSANLNPERVEAGALNGENLRDLFHLWRDSLRKEGSTPFHRSYMVKTPWLRKLCGLEKVLDLKGCNFSVAREKMLVINGFDESYEGYGREDTDVELRLQNLGLKIKSAKNLCLQFHLWHKTRAFTPINEELLDSVRTSRRIKSLRGLKESEKF